MEPKRFLLKGSTVQNLQAQVRLEYGSDARIILVERVTVGGIRGFFAREHFEATVELLPKRQRPGHAVLDMPARLGIAALLDDADRAEARSNGVSGDPGVSTTSPDFAALMDDLTFATAPPAAVPPLRPALGEAPAYLARPGDLVLVIGLTDEGFDVARAIADGSAGGALRVGGALAPRGVDRVDDRRDAQGARARGVELSQAVFLAFGLSRPGMTVATDLAMRAASLASVAADQVWVVVDAGRKTEDTAQWVQAIAESVGIDGVLAIGRGLTSTPDSVYDLQLPVRWLDPAAPTPTSGRRAAAPARSLADGSR